MHGSPDIPLIGRAAELDALRQALRAPGARVQVVGPPGIGKSALARAALAELDGVWVPLGPDADALEAASTALGVPADPGAVRGALGGRVLALDGVEGALDGVRALLDGLPGVSALLTTRQRAPGVRLIELGPLPEDDGVALFLARAATVGGAGEDPGAVRALVRRLEGWPLALELAAGRTRLYAARELLAEPPLAVLADGSTSLAGALDASWALLAEGDRAALARVALFHAPFDREAFREVTGAELGALERLMDASLVRWSAVDGGRRYHLLAPIRAHALTRLGEDPEARSRYAEAVLGRAERAAQATETSGAAAARAELGRSVSDLRALAAGGGVAGARAALALGVLARAWGRPREAEQTLHRVERAGLPPALLQQLAWLEADLAVRGYSGERALAALEGLPEDATTLRLRGLAALRLGRPAEGAEVLARAVRAAEADPDPRAAVEAWYALGVTLIQHGAKGAARDALREALDRVVALDAPDLDGLIRKFIALVERDLGVNLEGRRALAEAAVARHVQSGNLRLEAMAHNMLAIVALDAGDPDALAIVDALAALAERVGVRTTLEAAHIHRALLALERADAEAAGRALEPLLGPEVAPFNRAWAVGLGGMAALHRGDRAEAVARIRESIAGLDALGLRADASLMHGALAVLGEGPPPPLFEELPSEAPLRVVWEVATRTVAGEPLPPTLEAAARRSMEARLVLSLALAGVGTAVGASGAWFQPSGGERVDLSRRRVLRRVLGALAAQHGRAITHEELLAEAWPGERTTAASGRARVHVAISDLRRLGLRDDLETVERDGGAAYRLRARVVAG